HRFHYSCQHSSPCGLQEITDSFQPFLTFPSSAPDINSMLVALQAPYRTTCSTGPVQHSDLHHNVTAAIRCTLTSGGEEA
ncbi:hypothetical protein KUCAC02_001880, partial [Chaenocephalus aceratus]